MPLLKVMTGTTVSAHRPSTRTKTILKLLHFLSLSFSRTQQAKPSFIFINNNPNSITAPMYVLHLKETHVFMKLICQYWSTRQQQRYSKALNATNSTFCLLFLHKTTTAVLKLALVTAKKCHEEVNFHPSYKLPSSQWQVRTTHYSWLR